RGIVRKGRAVGLALALAAAALVSVSGTPPAAADVDEVQGSAAGLEVDGLGGLVDLPPTPSVALPGDGSGGSETDSVLDLPVPLLGSAGEIEVTTTGSPGVDGTVTSTAEVTNLDLAFG